MLSNGPLSAVHLPGAVAGVAVGQHDQLGRTLPVLPAGGGDAIQRPAHALGDIRAKGRLELRGPHQVAAGRLRQEGLPPRQQGTGLRTGQSVPHPVREMRHADVQLGPQERQHLQEDQLPFIPERLTPPPETDAGSSLLSILPETSTAMTT